MITAFVNITVHISADAMSAYLTLEPVLGEVGTLTVEQMSAALDKAGVVRGISMAALQEVAKDWNGKPRLLTTKPVATGAEAVSEKQGPIRMMVKHLAAPNDIKTARNSHFFWELNALSMSHKVQRVDSGTVIARRLSGSVAMLGYTVRGEPMMPPDSTPVNRDKITERDNVFVASNTYTAATTGIVYIDDDDEPHVIPLDFNGAAELNVASSMMSAELIIKPAGERGIMPTEEYIRGLIINHGVIFGVIEEELSEVAARIAEGLVVEMKFLIAEGVPPIKGDDGHIELCFNAESSPTPTINPDGSADYKNISIVATVCAGTVLARLNPPNAGTPGRDIMGRTLPAKIGNPVKLPVGANTAIPKGEPTTLIAVTDGIPQYTGSAINVSEGYITPGNVDYSTGNINYANSVEIKGDIKSGFSVDCGGDLQVNGIIEDCKITVGGNVLCRYGFVGTGKGVIEAKGDVSLLFSKNQTIVAEGIVNIAKESINSNIIGRKAVNIYGNRLSVAGGTLISTGAIVVKTVGNITGIQTTLQIDPDPGLMEEYAKEQVAIDQYKNSLNKLTMSLTSLPIDKKNDKEFIRRLKNTIITTNQQIASIDDNMRSLRILMDKFDNSFIRIDRIAYPGTIIRFGKRQITLTDMLTGGKTIKSTGGEIKIY